MKWSRLAVLSLTVLPLLAPTWPPASLSPAAGLGPRHWPAGPGPAGSVARPAAVLTVCPAGPPSCDYSAIQDAVNAAVDGDTVKVATGVYVGVRTIPGLGTPNFTATQLVALTKSLTLQGGYTTTNWAEPDPERYPTTLDAEDQGRVLVITGSITVTLDGLCLVGGNADGLGYNGGAAYIHTAAVSISNTLVEDNAAPPRYEWEFPVDGTGQGGGLYLFHSDVQLISSTVQGNTCREGGGLYVDGGHTFVDRSLLRDNVAQAVYIMGADGAGGGLYGAHCQITLTNNILENNLGGGSGGGLVLYASTASIVSNKVTSNESWAASGGYGHGTGGGLHIAGSSVELENNDISYNATAVSYRGGCAGGGVYLGNSSATLTGDAIRYNLTAGTGGGCYIVSSTVSFTNTLVQGNNVGFFDWGVLKNGGGGVFLEGSDAKFVNSIIVDNQVYTDTHGFLDAVGSGVLIAGSSAHLLHSTIARNRGGDGSAIYVDGSAYLTNTIVASHTLGITVTSGGMAKLEATLWGAGPWANGTDWGGDGTIITGTRNYWGHPDFVSPETGDYHIAGGSAAIDAGVAAGVNRDIDGGARPFGAGYDIGADEFSSTGMWLYPPTQLGQAAPGEHYLYSGGLRNFTGQANRFVLTTSDHSWSTTLSPSETAPLSDGASITFTVRVDVPAEAGWYDVDTALVQAASLSSPVVYSDTAAVTTQAYAPPRISVNPTILTGTVPLSGTMARPLSIANAFGVTLTFGLGAGAPWLSVDPFSGTVAPSDSRDVLVTFDAITLTEGVYTATLSVQSNDPTSPRIDVPVTMTVTAALASHLIYLPLVQHNWPSESSPEAKGLRLRDGSPLTGAKKNR